MKKIAITTSSFARFSDEPLRLLKKAGLAPLLNPHGRTLTADEAVEFLEGCAGVIAGTEPLTKDVLTRLPALRAISRCGAGLDSVDLAAAKSLGIHVANTPDAPTVAVAELTIGLALDLLRHISQQDRAIRAGVWKKRMGGLLAGKKVGLVGLGRIGRAVRARFEALGASCAYADPFVSGEPGRMELGELTAWADILSLHVPKTGDTPLFDAPLIARMKPGAFFINAARGGLVDEEALAAALADGRLAGAALDVFAREPYDGPLASREDVILTPHVGSYAREARIEMETEAARHLIRLLQEAGALP